MTKITLPKSLLELSDTDRKEILAVLLEASQLPETKELPHTGGDEHNIWETNSDTLLGDAENELYILLADHERDTIEDLMLAMGLPFNRDEFTKSLEPEYLAFEDELIKAQDKSGRNRMSDKIKELAAVTKQKTQQFMKWVNDGKSMTKTQMTNIEKILSRNLPNYTKMAESFMTRAGFIGKIRNKADEENMSTLGAYIDRIPNTVEKAQKEGVVLTLREKQKAEAQGRKVKILPLTPHEAESVKHAALHAGDKLTEISAKHIAGVRQLVIQAKRERWTAQRLAQALFDKFGDHNRDWRRVAITELAFATNDAFLSGCSEGDRVIGMGAVNACPHCKRLIIGKEFIIRSTPPERETYTTDTKEIWLGKSNYGRRVAEYVAAVPLHPNCRCRLHKISRFYNVGKDGKLELKSTAELINEERARRGLAPDKSLTEGGSTEDRLRKLSEEFIRKNS
jgi:hypothetical protein